jgi:hypothetical protein
MKLEEARGLTGARFERVAFGTDDDDDDDDELNDASDDEATFLKVAHCSSTLPKTFST